MADLSLRCCVCQSMLDEEDLFCPNCGTEAPKPQQKLPAAADASRVATCNFQCSGCGASMSYDASAGSLRCPFCGSVDLLPQRDAKILAPKCVVPFRLQREEAVAVMRRWLGRGFFRPGDLKQRAAVVQMQPVFVPYWVFQARTHTHWTADTSQTPPGARGHWYPLAGEHHAGYANLLIGASGALTPRETAEICPFDLAAGAAPDKVDLDNITVEQFSVPRKYARPLACGGLEQLEAQACAVAYVPGRSRNVHVNLRIEDMASEPVLLPVWIMAYRYNNQVFRFLVNGQTGRATGSAPLSWLKILLIPAIVVAVVLLVVMCSGIFSAAMHVKLGLGRPGAYPMPFYSQCLAGRELRLPVYCIRWMRGEHTTRMGYPAMPDDERYLATIRQALDVCKRYIPKFGQRAKSGFTLAKFQQLYKADPFYTWFGLNSPLVYAAHKAAGGITSVYRQIGTGVERVFRLMLQDSLGQTEDESNWSYTVPTTKGKARTLSLDGRITLPSVRVPSRAHRVSTWLQEAMARVGLEGRAAADLEGVVFECRQGYKSKDAKRQNADVANAANAYARNYLPCVMLFSLQIDADVAERYVRAQWLLLTGSLEGSSLDSTYVFCREVLGYDLAGFLERNSRTIRKDVDEVLRELLR